jgi:hypothetical protein
MNVTIIIEAMALAIIVAAFLTPILEAPAKALGPSGQCYLDCTGGGFPSSPRQHNACLTACVFGEGVQRLDEGIVPGKPKPSDSPRGRQTGRN